MKGFINDCIDELDANRPYLRRPAQTVKDGVSNWRNAADGIDATVQIAAFVVAVPLFVFVVVPFGLVGKFIRAK